MKSNFYTSKNPYRIFFLFTFLMFFLVNFTEGQVFWQDDFESAIGPEVGGGTRTSSVGPAATGQCCNFDKFVRDNTFGSGTCCGCNATFTSINNSYAWGGEDLDGGNGCSSAIQTITWGGIDISGKVNFQFKGLFGIRHVTSFEGSDQLKVQWRIDGGALNNGIGFEPGSSCGTGDDLAEDADCDGTPDGPCLSDDLTEHSFIISGSGTTLELIFTANIDGGGEEFVIDNFRVLENVLPSTIVCPTVGAASASETHACLFEPFNVTATGLVGMDNATNMEQDFGIEFVAFTSTPADPYVGGTSLGSVAFGSLTGGGTTASLTSTSLGTAGTYEIYAILSPTPTDGTCRPSAMTSIIVLPNPTVTLVIPAAEDEYCVDDPLTTINLAGSPSGGVYSGTGVSDLNNGMTFTFNPAVAGVGTHTVSYLYTDGDGCMNTATDDITVNALPTVSMTAPADLCLNAGVQAGLGGGTPTGGVYSGMGVTDDSNGMTYSFDPASAGVGTHTITYTFTDVNGCTNSDDDDVEVFAVPTAAFTALADLCLNAGVQTGLGGGTPTGGVYSGPGVTDGVNGMTYSFDPAAAGVGTHTLTYTVGVAGCFDSATDDVEVFALPMVTFTAPGDQCLNDPASPHAFLGSPTGGVYSGPGVTNIGDGQIFIFTPSNAGVGIHTITYTLTDANGCTNSASDMIEVFALPIVTFTAPADLCLNAGVQAGLGGGTPTGGVYSGMGVTDDSNGMTYSFDPAAAGVGTHTITYTFTDANGCTNSDDDDVEVFALPTAAFTALADLCLNAGVQTGLGGGTPTGGVYSGMGVTDDSNGMTYSFDPAAAGVGTHTLTYTVGVAGCFDSATDDVEVFALPTVTFTAPADECLNDPASPHAFLGSPTGGVYSGPGVTNNGDGQIFIFTPSNAGVGVHTITYTFTDANGCTNSASDMIEVFALPTVTFTAPADLCLNAGVQAGLGGGTPTGGVYSGMGVTDDGNGMTYSFDPAAAGVGTHTITYTFTDANGCTNSDDDDVEIFALPTVMFTAPADLCITAGVQTGLGGGTPVAGIGETGVYSGMGVTDDGNGMTYSFDPAAAGVGTHTLTYTFTDANGCTGSASDDVEVFSTVAASFTALPDLCENDGVQAGLGGGMPAAGAGETGVYSGPGVTDDGNNMTYSFDPAAAGVGTHTITYTFTTAAGCMGTGMDDVEVFAAPVVTFTALADLSITAGTQTGLGGGTPTGGVYSGPGVTDDANGMTYSFDPVAAGPGIHTLTYTFTDGNGCTDSASDDVEVFEVDPMISQVDEDGDGNPDILDPCACSDPMNMPVNGMLYYHDFITVTSNPGEIWEVTAITSGAMHELPLPSPLTAPVALTDVGPGVLPGSRIYRIDFWTLSGQGFAATVDRVGNPFPLMTMGTCTDADPPVFTTMCPASTTIECSDPIPAAPIMMATDVCGFPGSAAAPDVVFINEIHYDNAGTDTGEFIEVAGTAGLDLAGYSLVLYNGNSGMAPYNTIVLAGIIDDEGMGAGAVDFQFPTNGIQNGPDGVALVDPMGNVIEFLSYEGTTLTAIGGPANGMVSTNIGVSENSSTLVGESLQLIGTGMMSSDFTWGGPLAESPGDLNAMQILMIGAGGNLTMGPVTIDVVENFVVDPICPNGGVLTRTWTATDAAGNPTVCTQTITIEDNIAPSFVETPLPADVTVECSAIPAAAILSAIDNCGSVVPWVNEFHYDNTGGDVGEFIEIAGEAGTDLTGYSLELYNGANGLSYNLISLSGIIPDEGQGYGAIDFQLPANGLQNGGPDGFALIDPMLSILEFLSYEGTFIAANGNANGMSSTNVGVSESSATLVGESLQLTGMGTMSSDFAWSGPAAESPGTLNIGQTIAGDLPVVFAENTVAGACAGASTITRTWTATDDCGNPVTHTQTITVEDNTPPTVACQNISIFLDGDGNATILPSDIDNGSSDLCGPVTLSLSQTDFTCANIGDNTVVLTVTDDCGNSATCTATVTIADNLPPVMNCPGDQTIHLDPGACEQVLSYDVTAVDNCEGMLTTTFLGTTFIDDNGFAGNMFDVTNIGTAPITITSFDVHLETGAGTNHTVAAYSVLGGYAGNETNAAAWILIGDVPVISAGPGNPSPMPAGGLTIQAGEVYGIYIYQTDGGSNIDYTNGANTYSDANMQIDAGLGRGTPIWTGGIFNPRTWNGNVHYSIVTGAPPIVQMTAGLPSGSAFPIGTTINTWTATDNYGNTSTCTWEVTVVEYVPTSNDITCNDLVHISLDENCEAIVGADQILEGNNYGCYDNYIVTFANTGLPVILNGTHAGNTYEVMVTNPAGIACWGYILVEDKLIPDLVCSNDDITVRCDEDTDPGSSYVATSDMVAPTMSVDNATVSETVTFGASNGSVVDVNVTVESDHTWVGDLVISITSPTGTSVELMNNIGGPGFGCAGDGLDLVFDDAATMTYADLDGTCNNNPAAEGTFQPLEALSLLNGEPAVGDWIISVTDLAGGDSGDVNVTINLSANSVIPFPVPATATVTPTADPYTFNVSDFDPCGNTVLTYSDIESGDLCVGNAQIERTWVATDESGNTTTCTEIITITPTTLADVVADLPTDITVNYEC